MPTPMTLRLPDQVRTELRADGEANGRTLHQQIVHVLAARYGIEVAPVRRGRRPKDASGGEGT